MEVGAIFDDTDELKEVNEPYQEGCSHILWPAIIGRPDIIHAVVMLAHYICNLRKVHWEAIKHIMRYLYTMRDMWLTLGGGSEKLVGVANADWGSQKDRHSISGYAMQIGSGTISWSSKQQSIIVLLTAEAKFVVATEACKEIIWIYPFLKELGFEPSRPTTLMCDNQSTIALCKDSKFHVHMKYIDIHYHFICKNFDSRNLEPKYVPSNKNVADILMKALPRLRFEKLHDALGIQA
jgi:hypothetical protein